MKMLTFIDKIFQLNLYGAGAAFAAEKVGLVTLESITSSFTRDHLYENALFVSAVTAAIYGTYRVGKLVFDGIKLLTKKKQKKDEGRETNRRSK